MSTSPFPLKQEKQLKEIMPFVITVRCKDNKWKKLLGRINRIDDAIEQDYQGYEYSDEDDEDSFD